MDNTWAWLGGGAVIAALASVWSYIRNVWTQLLSRLIVTMNFNDAIACRAVEYALWHSFTPSRFGMPHYKAFICRVRAIGRIRTVPAEEVTGSKLFWRGWRPVWANYNTQEDKMTVSFFRGTIQHDKFFVDACEEWDTRFSGMHQERRFSIKYHHGTAGKPANLSTNDKGNRSHSSPSYLMSDDSADVYARRLLRWSYKELGEDLDPGYEIAKLALSSEAEKFVRDVKQWRASELWYKKRSIAWKLSCLLKGQAGTGKTSLLRALAKDMDLPVHVFDLTTFFNDEFKAAWSKAAQLAPCLMVLEDIDSAFNGRAKLSELTFDCLLNCLDGFEATDGLLVGITTNKPETIDPALGVIDEQGRSSRPGRVDRIIEMGPPDYPGRYKIAMRVVTDPVLAKSLAHAGDGETGAQFQDRCKSAALALLQTQDVAEYAGSDQPGAPMYIIPGFDDDVPESIFPHGL